MSRRKFLAGAATVATAGVAGCNTNPADTEQTEGDDLGETANEALEPGNSEDTAEETTETEEGFESLEEAADWANQQMLAFGYRPMSGEDRVVSINNYGDEENERTVRFQTRVGDIMENSGIQNATPDMKTLSAAGGDAIERFIDDIRPEVARHFDIYEEAFSSFDSIEDQRDDSGEPEEGDYSGARIEIGGRLSSWILGYDGAQVNDIHAFSDIEDLNGTEEVTEVETRVAESLLDDQKSESGFVGGRFHSDEYNGKVYVSEGEVGQVKLDDGRNVSISFRENETGFEVVVDGNSYHIGKSEEVKQLEEEYGLEHDEINPVAPYDEGAVFEGVHEDQLFDVYTE